MTFLGPIVRVGAWVRWKRNREEKKWASWRKEQGEDAVAERRDIWALACAVAPPSLLSGSFTERWLPRVLD